MTTIRYHAEDLPAATAWYTQVLGTEPYFTSPRYVEFRVDDVEAAYRRLLDLGATDHLPPFQYGEGFIAVSVVDPFDNILGVMENRHYREIVERNPSLDRAEIAPVTRPGS